MEVDVVYEMVKMYSILAMSQNLLCQAE